MKKYRFEENENLKLKVDLYGYIFKQKFKSTASVGEKFLSFLI